MARNVEKREFVYVSLQFMCDILLYIDLNVKIKKQKKILIFFNCLNSAYFWIALLFFEAVVLYLSKKLRRH